MKNNSFGGRSLVVVIIVGILYMVSIGDVSFVTRSVPVSRLRQVTLLVTEGHSSIQVTLFVTEGTSPKCAVGEFSYMAYDNLGSEAEK